MTGGIRQEGVSVPMGVGLPPHYQQPLQSDLSNFCVQIECAKPLYEKIEAKRHYENSTKSLTGKTTIVDIGDNYC